MRTVLRHWFRIDREWVKRREAILRAQEDMMIRAARDEASGELRALMDALVEERDRNLLMARYTTPTR